MEDMFDPVRRKPFRDPLHVPRCRIAILAAEKADHRTDILSSRSKGVTVPPQASKHIGAVIGNRTGNVRKAARAKKCVPAAHAMPHDEYTFAFSPGAEPQNSIVARMSSTISVSFRNCLRSRIGTSGFWRWVISGIATRYPCDSEGGGDPLRKAVEPAAWIHQEDQRRAVASRRLEHMNVHLVAIDGNALQSWHSSRYDPRSFVRVIVFPPRP